MPGAWTAGVAVLRGRTVIVATASYVAPKVGDPQNQNPVRRVSDRRSGSRTSGAIRWEVCDRSAPAWPVAVSASCQVMPCAGWPACGRGHLVVADCGIVGPQRADEVDLQLRDLRPTGGLRLPQDLLPDREVTPSAQG
jgi:hypothetical protein